MFIQTNKQICFWWGEKSTGGAEADLTIRVPEAKACVRVYLIFLTFPLTFFSKKKVLFFIFFYSDNKELGQTVTNVIGMCLTISIYLFDH